MFYTRLVKLAMLFSAFTTGGLAEVAWDGQHWILLMVVAVIGSLLCQFLLDVYFHVRLKEYEIEARKDYVSAVWSRDF